jgi:hypothetical protein
VVWKTLIFSACCSYGYESKVFQATIFLGVMQCAYAHLVMAAFRSFYSGVWRFCSALLFGRKAHK